MLVTLSSVGPTEAAPLFQTTPSVSIISPEDGAILSGAVMLQANVSDTTATSVEFFYQANEAPGSTSLGLASFDSTTGFWVLAWDTTLVLDTYNDIDTNGDGIEDLMVNLTKPPTNDQLSVVATTGAGPLTDIIDIRIQNMVTVRIFLPDNQEDIRGFEDLEVLTTGQHPITSVRFDVYPTSAGDPRIFIPYGEFETQGEPIENPHYGRPLGNPVYPIGPASYSIGPAIPEGSKRWVFRNWDTTTVPDGTWLIVATAEDTMGRRATYTVETYIVNDLRVVITAPDDGATVSRFVALEARTSSMTGADNAAPGSLWPATSVVFTIGSTNIPATENPSGSGRWRAVWDGDSFAPGPYTITATATNANPGGAEIATDSVDVTLVAPGTELEAFFPFDWSYCTLYVCSFLDGSSGGPNSWLWEFGDGNTSTAQLPIHIYANYGVYTVTLTVSDGVTTSSYSRVIPVGNTAAVGFNINPINDGATEFINWTSAFKNFEYNVGDTLAIPVMWKSTTGATQFLSLPGAKCDAVEDTPNQECVIFTPEEADGTAPTLVSAVQDGVLFTMEFTEVQYRGITDIFKGKANLRINVATDSGDGNPDLDWEAQLGTNVDVTNSGVEGDENRVVKIISPFDGQFVGGTVTLTAGTVSSVVANQVEFFVNGTSIGTDTDGANGWSASWNTTAFAEGSYQLTAIATFAGSETAISTVVNVTVENTIPTEPPAPTGTFQIGRVSDTTGEFITYPFELEEAGGGGPPRDRQPSMDTSMTAVISNIIVLPGDGLIGGDAIEFDVTITNTSSDPGAVLTAYAFQSKFSESPALASRIGDKAYFATLEAGAVSGRMASVKKNGTSNGLFGGRWKGICINSSEDFLPEFNSGLEDESLECGGNRADADFDGLPELQFPIRGIPPGESQTVRLRIEAGTTDGALHVVEPGTLRGKVEGTPVTGPNGLTYFVPTINNTGITDPNVLSIPDFGDNKVLRDADGTFNPTFAPLADGLTFENQTYLTLPRRNFAFTDILGRNHTCETYGLDHIPGTSCFGNPSASPVFGFLGTGDLVPGVQNFAAILHGFGEYVETGDPDNPYAAPNFPYDTPCVNLATPDGLRCGARPFTPIAEFYRDNGDGTVTQQVVGGSYGALGSSDQYTAFIGSATTDEWKEEAIPEIDPGGPCNPIEDPDSRRAACAQLRTSATGHFHNLTVLERAGINGGDVVEFTINITNTSTNPEAYLTAFNYQTKQRSLADIGILDGYTQDRRDVRLDSTLPLCTSLADPACYNSSLGIGHFPNVIGNGLLFGQMVWQSGRVDRAGQTIVPDFVAVDPVNGIDPAPFKLESVKKNGPFAPILKGNVNFICAKSGLFAPDQDADASCAGVPAILIDPSGEPIPSNISQRLGLAPGETQSVRIRMEFGDFRGAVLQIAAGTLNSSNVEPAYASTEGLARFFDCEDQRELEFCHPFLVGEGIDYLPNTTATWLTPETLEEIEWVIINQPGDAPRLMNFQENFGLILAMAGFIPSAEFYAPDPNPDLIGTPYQGILIRQQVLGEYAMTSYPPSSGNADLALTSSASSDPVVEGEELTYTLSVTNNGPAAATNVVLTNTLPTDVTYVSATPDQGTCEESGDVITCTLGSLANGANAVVSIVVTVGSEGQIISTASVTSTESDPDFDNNIASVEASVIPAGGSGPELTSDLETVAADEGEAAENSGTVSNPNPDPLTLTASVGEVIDNADGTWLWAFDTTDGPAESQTVTISADDGNGNTTAITFELVVNNVAPTADFTNDSGTITAPGIATLTFSNQFDPSEADTLEGFLYSYDCTNSGSFLIQQSDSPTFNCMYDADGLYTALGRIEDKDGGYSDYTVEVNVQAGANSSPSVVADAPSVSVDEGSQAQNTGTVSDPDGDTVTLSASAGDVTNNDDGTWTWTFDSTDGPIESQTVTISADDGQGNTSSTNFELTVNNLPPTAIFTNATGDVLVGEAVMFTFSGQADPSASDTTAGFVYAYDCTSDGVWEAENSMSPAYPCTYDQADTFTATGRISDKDGGFSEYTAGVSVQSVPNQLPVADAGPDQTITDTDNNGSEAVTLDGSASTDSDGNIVNYQWLEDDVEIANGVTAQVVLSVGTHTITLTVTDDDGGQHSDTTVITVLAPAIEEITATYQVNRSSDDVNEDGNQFEPGHTSIWVGAGSSHTKSYTGLRFNNVAIPTGATIREAYLEFYTPTTSWIGLDLMIAAEAIDNSATFTSNNRPSHRSLTTNYVQHLSDTRWGAGTWNSLGDITPVIQEVVNRPGWQSGNSLAVILKATGGPWARKFVTSYDGNPLFAPRLVIVLDLVTTNAPPVAQPDQASTWINTPVVIDVLANDTDANNDVLRIVSVTPALNGTVTHTDSVVNYTPHLDFNDVDTFTYTVCDPSNACATGTVTVTVNSASIQTAQVQVNQSSDDVNVDGNEFSASHPSIWVGAGASGAQSFTGLRFNSVGIPQGSTILSAKVEFYSQASNWIGLDLMIAAEAIDNSATFTNSNRPSHRSLTTNYVQHLSDSLWSSGTWNDLGDITSVIQEVVNRPGWQSGNSLSVILKATGGPWARKFVTSYDGNPLFAPRLVITYASPATFGPTSFASRQASTPVPIQLTSGPMAGFTADVFRGNAPLAVHFTNQSSGKIQTYQWDFGDGSISAEANPNHVFANPGIYTVTLTAIGDGKSNSAQMTIAVEAPVPVVSTPVPPTAALVTSAVSGDAPLMVMFTNQSSGEISGYVWDFGDGATSAEANPTHTYTSGGQFTVTLTVSGPGGTASAQMSVVVNVPAPPTPVPPTAAFATSVVSGDAPLMVMFTNQSSGEISGYVWDFGDGATSAEANPTHTYTSGGQFTVTLTVSGPGGTASAQGAVAVTESSDQAETPTEQS